MAAHDDDNPPPEEFQKLAKMTEKKWNVYRRPITLVLNVGLFVSTIVISRKKYFLRKKIFFPWKKKLNVCIVVQLPEPNCKYWWVGYVPDIWVFESWNFYGVSS